MSIQFAKPLDYQTVVDQITTRINNAETNFHIWETVQAIVSKCEGKQIDKRVTDAVAEAMGPEYHVWLSKSGDITLKYRAISSPSVSPSTIYLNGYSFGGHNTGPGFDGRINLKYIIEQNQWIILEGGRADVLQGLLDKRTGLRLIDAIIAWNAALNILQNTHEAMKQYDYPVTSIFDLNVRS